MTIVNGKLKWQHRVRQIFLSSTISKVNKKSKMNFYVNEFSKSISKSLSIHASFCICCGSYPFCPCFDPLFLCFTQFCGGSYCLKCHLTLIFHNLRLGPRNLKAFFPWEVAFSTSKSLQLVCASQYKVT